MRERPYTMLTLSTLLLAAGTLTDVGSVHAGGKKEKAEMAAAAKVTIDQAAKAATEKTAGKVIEAELEKKHGKIIWEVKTVDAEGTVTETHIDAESGAVIESKAKK
jgi:uncharacterized membrane protein YkoI